ncbi:MAG: T9SS type A sorting domain-containing protein, partial [Chlorobi bacterium]|nr:T9SS type A sorting domain-containing protein [Chlorobiota bacterium]
KAADIKGGVISQGGQRIDGAGGPDANGYIWRDSDDANGPVYVWNDISSTGTEMNFPNGNQDDGWTNSLNLGFTFNFYGTNYSSVRFTSNGLISFAPLTSSFRSNEDIPYDNEPNEFIAAFWDDLTGKNQGGYFYQQDGDRFIVQFNDIQKYYSASAGGPSGHYTFQVAIEANGKIKIYYKEMIGATDEATVGIENEDGSIGMEVAYNASYPQSDQFALQFMLEPEWISSDDLGGGRLYNGNGANVELSFDAADLAEGTYSMDVVISSNAPDKSVIVVPVTMTVYDPTPVELASFAARSEKGKVILTWTTATETNNKGFQIEKRIGDAESDWKSVGFVEGKGTTSKPANYTFNDVAEQRNGGKMVYRLKQIDFGGTFSYSDIVEVEASPVKFSLEQNYPNPFNPATKIEFSLPEKSDVRLSVYNSLGEKVITLVNEIKESGRHSVEWNAGNAEDGLPSGIYIYRIEANSINGNGGFIQAKKMLLLK